MLDHEEPGVSNLLDLLAGHTVIADKYRDRSDVGEATPEEGYVTGMGNADQSGDSSGE